MRHLSPIRVLHVITRLELGGAQRNTLYTVDHLDRGQFAPGLAWGPGDRLDAETEGLSDVALFPVNNLVRPVAPTRDVKALCQLRGIMRQFRPHIVHTHSSKAGVLGRLAARMEKVPSVIHSIHGFGFTPLQPVAVRALFFAAERAMSGYTDHFVAVSRTNLERGVELGLFTRQTVTLIRSGIAIRQFRNAGGGNRVRRRLGLPPAVPVVTQIGNFKAQKAPLDFVRVAARVADEVPEVRFVMSGEGPLRARAESLAKELHLAPRIVFCGWWDDVPGLLAASRVAVLTSRHEGLPRGVVEALAAGVPVVATAVDGTPEVVRDGVNGVLAQPGDVRALARGVCALLQNPDLHRGLASRAGQGLEEFDIDLMVRQQEELYRWIHGRSRS